MPNPQPQKLSQLKQVVARQIGHHGWLALLMLAVAGFLLLGYVLWSAHERIWDEAKDTAENYVQLIEIRFDAALHRVDNELEDVAQRIPPEALKASAAPRYRNNLESELLQHQQQLLDSVGIAGLRVTDAEGNVLYKAGNGPYINLAERSYFVALHDTKKPGLVISEAIRSRINGHMVLVLARGIYDREGRFLGMVSVPVDIEKIDHYFDAMRLGAHGALAIRRVDDHRLVLRHPLAVNELNMPLAANHPVRAALAAANNGTLEFVAQADGVRRIYAYRQLQRYPFYVLAGLAHEDVTAAWRKQALIVGSLSLFMLAIFVSLLFLLLRAQAREVLAAEHIRQEQQRLREAQRVAHIGSWQFDLLSQTALWSEEIYQILEMPPDQPANHAVFLQRTHPDDRLAVESATRDALAKQTHYQLEQRLLMSDGRVKHVLVCAETRYDTAGKPLLMLGSMQDLTSVRQMEAQMQLLASAFKYSGEAILITDRDNKIVTVNPAFTDLTGYSAEEAVGQNPRMLSAGRTTKAEYAAMWQAILADGFWQGEIWDRRKDGGVYPKWMSVSLIRDDAGETRYHVAHFCDISAERAVEAKLEHIAHHDMLTGLLNRHSLEGRLEQALAAARREGGHLALLFIDLDRFKVINDTLGHHVGDELLIEVARRLGASVRDSDVVARLGGDEFVIMLTGLERSASIAMIAENLVLGVGEPYVIEAHQLYTSPSIGIAIYPMDGEDGQTLMKNADAAMYHAKSAGRNNFQFFDQRMNDVAQERLSIEHNLRRALANNEFFLHFQPILDSKTGRVSAVEALIRWLHPEQGLIVPSRFIPIAEETGLIQPIGEWVFWAACRQLADFKAAGISGIKMSINISAMQMRNDNLPVLAKGAIEALNLNPSDLVFEITESVAMSRPEETVRILDSLHNMGIGLAIDDFGTGYSSLSYLQQFPIDHLKLDRAFVEEICEESGSSICDATIGLAHALGLKLVAEGVETETQADYLAERKCDLLQGFLYSRPLSSEQLISFILQHKAPDGG